MPDTEPTVAGYRRVRVLRRDALGEVYQAIHEKTSQPVCLRVLMSPEGMDASTWVGLRYRLVGTLLSLQQVTDVPRMEAIQGVGEVGEGIWVVTEYLDGVTLEDRRQTAGPTAYQEAMGILRAVAEAIDALHERGLVHGWLNAERVLVTRENELRLLGVGLGIVPGSAPAKYSAPEREADGPTRANDIYAFGVLIRKVIGAEQITLPVKAVMDKLTATDPDNRYRRAIEAVEDLEQGKIPMPVTPTVTIPPPSTVATPVAIPVDDDVTPTVPLPPRVPGAVAPPLPAAVPVAPAVTPASIPVARTNGTAKTANAPTTPTAPMKAPRATEAAIMPAARQNQLERMWMVIAVIVFIGALGGLYLLLSNQKPNPAASPKPGATKTSSEHAKHADTRRAR